MTEQTDELLADLKAEKQRVKELETLIAQTDDEGLKRQAGLCSCSSEWDKYCPIHGKNSRGSDGVPEAPWRFYPFLKNNDGVARQPWNRCPSCLCREWKPFIWNPPLRGSKQDWFVWVRCLHCGNIAASVPLLKSDSRPPMNHAYVK